ncbi:membrane-bound lytic murein transglycosylase D [Ectothiorhodospira magna]|uniref:Membrane-bound lytic murein transglycosylase D n=1 Tax=Ectothiorhodospira magna TaxID=867345 RepID=A0A1H9B2B2_9GAMM|nr:LysM peptidoglycan-binding domain-containing protein [Ectothiorhodospira magna]SEP82793.1 membrane-bound lytic murein transglycosylase D [Ectothiorhodospira magna]
MARYSTDLMRKNTPQMLRGSVLGAVSLLLLSACATLDGPGSVSDDPRSGGDAHADILRDTAEATAGHPPSQRRAPAPRPLDAQPVSADEAFWLRVRQGLAMPDKRNNDRVLHYIRWHQQHSDYLGQVLARAEPYLHYILEEIEARDLPAELLLLPVVESAYRSDVYSSGQAAGIWQFIPSTGRHFGLHQNWWYDGRKDIHASTQAALNYLAQLNQRFDGDWLLALAAYNAGQGTVGRAIARNASLGRPTDYWNLDLPRETQHYVPRLLALQVIVSDPKRYGVGLWPVPDEPRLGLVELEGQMALSVAADLADLSLDDIMQLNPGFQRWATPPDGPHHLLLPLDRVAPFQAALATLPPDQHISWVRHQVQPGETLGHIAERYDTTIAQVQQANNLRGHIIRAGADLMIPVPKDNTQSRSDHGSQSAPASYHRVHHQVQPGDTLWALSRTHGVPVQSLAAWNRIAHDAPLRPGQNLIIHQTLTTTPASASGYPSNTKTYIVQPGDSLSSISRRFGVRVSDIQQWNQLPDHRIWPGQSLQLHLDVQARGN